MKVVILAGGFGTRLAEETEKRPKPMVEIGGIPIMLHIMRHYGFYGINEFIIALGYKGDYIKRYFLDYYILNQDISLNLANGDIDIHDKHSEDWQVHLVDTGLNTLTGGRVKRLQNWLGDETFMLTYGDGVSNIDLEALLAFHRQHGRIATISAVRPPARFGGLNLTGQQVISFTEKPQAGEGWINGGFAVFEPGIFDYLSGDESSLESDAMDKLAADEQLMAFSHDAFWQCMDTVRDLNLLRRLWESDRAPWKIWE
ncbi:MAG: glucose-1-phosphate cytidylyltransferase [Anaerolineales bacterium]